MPVIRSAAILTYGFFLFAAGLAVLVGYALVKLYG